MPLALKNHTKAPINYIGALHQVAYTFTFAGEASGTRIDLEELPAGVELHDIEIVNDALGAGVTLAIGELFSSTADGTTSANSLKAATAASSAGVINGGFHPKLLNTKRTPTITTGGAAATGKISVLVQYSFIGNGQ